MTKESLVSRSDGHHFKDFDIEVFETGQKTKNKKTLPLSERQGERSPSN